MSPGIHLRRKKTHDILRHGEKFSFWKQGNTWILRWRSFVPPLRGRARTPLGGHALFSSGGRKTVASSSLSCRGELFGEARERLLPWRWRSRWFTPRHSSTTTFPAWMMIPFAAEGDKPRRFRRRARPSGGRRTSRVGFRLSCEHLPLCGVPAPRIVALSVSSRTLSVPGESAEGRFSIPIPRAKKILPDSSGRLRAENGNAHSGFFAYRGDSRRCGGDDIAAALRLWGEFGPGLPDCGRHSGCHGSRGGAGQDPGQGRGPGQDDLREYLRVGRCEKMCSRCDPGSAGSHRSRRGSDIASGSCSLP